MLFILTGDIQTGKTRFLEDLLAKLTRENINCYGVLAPGVWVDHGGHAACRYEKIGIDNLMLPQGERIAFAKRRDLKQANIEDKVSTGQSDEAQLAWAIDDNAIEKVNKHFDTIAQQLDSDSSTPGKGLLLIDEFGRLELLHEKGLTSAVTLLDQGPTALWTHAVLIVRDYLCDLSVERFGSSWKEWKLTAPGENLRKEIVSLYQGL